MKEIKNNRVHLAAALLIGLVIAGLLLLPGLRGRKRGGYAGYLPTSSTAEAAEVNSWTQAVQKVKEDRGEPTGKQAKVDIPQQLRHYSDTRRFLAIQVAEWREHQFNTPQDFVELAAIIQSGEMVELRPVSRDYILFGVGGSADKEPFTRYEQGKRIALYNEAELAQKYAQMAESRASVENEIAGLRQELKELSKRERSRRARLQSQLNEKQKALKAEQENKELLDRSYANADRRGQLLSDYETLASLSKSFSGRTYDIADARSRREMKVRMLSYLRPEALKVLEEVAVSYRQKFDRPLPITSLVRPEEYQHALSKTNPNATRIETPPHSTGLAFDIYYRFMTAEEQAHVMSHLARLKDEGRIEVLRENRDHYHVFAFVDGMRPDEALIRATLSKTTADKTTNGI
ncbi:MAG: hypothetical protein ICV68_03000 [Pyrinomonadaceae bacterium]|nr:hypothetical protein [Pyrinomonadaceae bacterium]